MDLPGVRQPQDACRFHERQVVFEGLFFDVVRQRFDLPNGIEATHEVLRYPSAVAVIPILGDPPGERQLLMIEQFRSSVGGFIHEIPAGTLEDGEDPLACARRELEEETGYLAARWTHVATLLATPGLSAVRMVYFLAEGLRPGGVQKLDDAECLTVERFPVRALVDSLVFGKSVAGVPPMVDGKVHMAAFFLGAYLRDSR